MKQDWDTRASHNAMYWTCLGDKPWTLPEFFEWGRTQVHDLTGPIFERMHLNPTGKRMLEIGCGTGRLIPGFIELFAEVWGVDVSAEMIKQANELHISPNVNLIQNNGYDLADIPDDHFDFVFSYLVFQHLPQKWLAFSYLAEIYRVLRPGDYHRYLV